MASKMETTLRQAVKADPRSLYAIANAAGVWYEPLRRFIRCGGGLNFTTAARIAQAVGLELRPAEGERK